MNRYNVNVLAEAKKEYTAQLVNTITPEVYVGLRSMYTAASEFCKRTNEKNVLIKFQTLLSKTPGWNQEKINNEFDRIQSSTNVDYLTDLLTAIFVSHTKVLASIKMKKNTQSFELDVPNGPHFIHKVYISCARKFWKYPFLFHTEFSNLDLQRNLLQAETFIKECIEETIRKLLPVKYVLKECLGDDYNDDDDSEEDIRSTISNTTKNNIRKLIKLEIEQTLSRNSQSDDKFSKLEIKDDTNPVNEQIENMIANTDNSIIETIQESTKEVLSEQKSSNESNQEDTETPNLNNEQTDNVEANLEKDDVLDEGVENTKESGDKDEIVLDNTETEDVTKEVKEIVLESAEDVQNIVTDDENSVQVETEDNPQKLDQNTELADENTEVTDENTEESSELTELKVLDKIVTGEMPNKEKKVTLLTQTNELKDKSDIKNIDLVISDKETSKNLETTKPKEKPVENKQEEKSNDVISLSRLQSLEDIRNEINKDIVENSVDNSDNNNDEFSFFDDAANF